MQTLKVPPKGLFTNYNQLAEIPAGALSRAQNVCIRRHGVAEPRNGMDILINSPVGYINNMFSFRNYLHWYNDPSSTTSPATLFYESRQTTTINNGLAISYSGSYYPPATLTNKIRAVEANSSLFFTSSIGIHKIQTPGGSIRKAGVQKAICASVTSSPTGFTLTDLSFSGSTITYADHNLTTGMIVQLAGISGSTLPTPLVAATNYYVIRLTANTFRLATTLANANAGTNIVITGVTAGSFSLTLGNNGFLPTNRQVAYRLIWGYKDDNGYTVLSAPSDRVVVSNTDTSTNLVYLTWLIPTSIDTTYFYQIYRSLPVATGITPTDELYLVTQNSPAAGDITNGYFTFTDNVADESLGATIYTAPSIEGIGQANDQPPICSDITYLNGSMFYSNPINKYRLTITLSSVVNPGLQLGDTVVIDSQTYTANVTESASNLRFKLYSTGTPTENINNTAKSLVRVINQNAGTSVYGYSLNDFTGDILIEERLIGGNIFSALCSRAGAFSPSITTALNASNDAYPNRLYVSKYQQIESVPIANYFTIGAQNKPIRRVVPLQDEILVFKDDGIFKITGASIDSFTVSIFDPETIIYGENTPVFMNQAVYVMTNKGVVYVTSSNVQSLSDPVQNIFPDTIRYQTPTGANVPFVTSDFQRYAFSIAYPQNHEYILFYTANTAGPQCDTAIVYNYLTDAWYQWDLNACIGIMFNNRLYTGLFAPNSAQNGYFPTILIEQKNNYNSDYLDIGFSRSGSTGGSSSTTVTVDTGGVEVGWFVVKNNSRSIVTAVVNSTTLTVSPAINLTGVGDTTLYKPIDVDVIFILNDGSNPGLEKQFIDATALLENSTISNVAFQFTTNYDNSFEGATATFTFDDAWGSGAWGSGAWGGSGTEQRSIRVNVPRDKTRGRYLFARLRNQKCYEKMAIIGISYTQNVNQDRTVTS